jgi:hypothetical protein
LELGTDGIFPDCHWTSLNFFNYSPKAIFNQNSIALDSLKNDFNEVTQPYEFGDILAWISPSGDVVHTCTYIAADIVFSKNGRNILTPWTLAHLDDIDSVYRQAPSGRCKMLIMRRKDKSKSS